MPGVGSRDHSRMIGWTTLLVVRAKQSIGMEVQHLLPGIARRPGIGIAPGVCAHGEVANGRHQFAFDTAQPAVEPG